MKYRLFDNLSFLSYLQVLKADWLYYFLITKRLGSKIERMLKVELLKQQKHLFILFICTR